MPIETRGAGRRSASAARRLLPGRPVGLLAAALLMLALSGCGQPRPLTFEEQDYYMAKQQCGEEATNMAGPSWGGNNPYWDDYFTMCMNQLGIPDAVINRMWY